MTKPESTDSNPRLSTKLSEIWKPGQREVEFSETFMISYSFYYLGKAALWNIPRTIAVTTGHAARRMQRWAQQKSEPNTTPS